MSLSRNIHAVIFGSGEHYVANCLEVAVVTQGRTLDETLTICAKPSACTWKTRIWLIWAWTAIPCFRS